MSNKTTHLEFIQNVITRMNTNSFMIKGWAITLISAIFALAAKDANHLYIFIVYIPLPMFWIMDGFYLSQERQYRGLYNHIASLAEDKINFLMSAKDYDKDDNTWWAATISKTLVPFYGTLFFLTIFVMFLIK